MSDQRSEDQSGVFLGWSMSLWGSVADPQKEHKPYIVPIEDEVLPPLPSNTTDDSTLSSILPSSTSTKTIPRPTEHLPGDHGESDGENHKPAFSTTGAASPTKPAEDVAESSTASPSITATPDEGWFSDLGKLASNQVWFFLAIGTVVIFGVGAGLFFWRRSVARKRRANYSSLREDDVAMSAVGRTSGGGRAPRQTKELYDAFGEVSDDEDADEETALRPHIASPDLHTGLHSGFLDDDDPPTAGSGHKETRYRDEPESPVDDEKEQSGPQSPGSGSGSGSSWEHASETR